MWGMAKEALFTWDHSSHSPPAATAGTHNGRCISPCPGENPWAPGVQAGPQGAWESGTVSKSRRDPSMMAEGHL